MRTLYFDPSLEPRARPSSFVGTQTLTVNDSLCVIV